MSCLGISVALCTLLFLSIISVSGVFAAYQSDGMLLEAGLFSVFFAPKGLRPGLAVSNAPSRIARFMLVWEWFRIYFESGVVKMASGDIQWRNFTALDHYIRKRTIAHLDWLARTAPTSRVSCFCTAVVLLVELLLVGAAFLSRPYKIALFFVVTALQVGLF